MTDQPVRPLEALIEEWRHVNNRGLYGRGMRRCADELAALLQAAAPPAPTAEHHRCSVCGLRWDNLPGVELCGDCWRSVPRPFTEHAAPPERVSEGKA
jgi:hypothetical protein